MTEKTTAPETGTRDDTIQPVTVSPQESVNEPEAAVVETTTPAAAPVVEVEPEQPDAEQAASPAELAPQDFVMVEPEAPAEAPQETEAMWDSLKPADEDPSEATGEEHAEQDIPPVKPAKIKTGPFAGNILGPKIACVPMMRDDDGKLVPTPPTIASRIFGILALTPLLVILALFAAQVLFALDVRALWFSDEVRYADAYTNMVKGGNWLVLHLNGEMYPDKPPLFFWFLNGIERVSTLALPLIAPLIPWKITLTQTMIFSLGMAVSGLLCLLAAHALAVFVARVDRRTVLASGIILMSCFFFTGLMHYLRMDLLFTALITFSHIFLYHAWMRRSALGLMTLGFLCAGLAVLVKGPLGLAFPLVTALFFLLWEGRITRLFRLDALWGIVLGAAIPGVWLTAAWMDSGDVFLNNILYKQILERALDTWHHAEPWYHYLMTFPLIAMPWTLLLLFLPWGRIFSKPVREAVKASRTPDASGTAYLWCAVIPGFVMLSLISIKLPIYALPLFPPLAILCAKGVLRMRPTPCAALQYITALILAVLGLAFMLLPIAPPNILALVSFPPAMPAGTMVLGGACLVTACILAFLVRPRRSEGLLLVMALFMAAFSFPAWSATAPSLDRVLSPKAQAEVIKKYRAAGYAPASFKVYPGTYSYYAGQVTNCRTWEDVTAFINKNPKALVALRAEFWKALADKPAGFTEVNRQYIAEREYVLVARPPLGDAATTVAPAPSPVTSPEQQTPPKAEPAASPPAGTGNPQAEPAEQPVGQAGGAS